MSKILDTNIECDIIKAVLVYLLAPPGRSLRSFISETAFFLLTITCLKTILKKTMFLLEIIPFIKIKGAETLTYFSSQKPAIGSLVLIKVKNSEVKGLVTEVQALKEHKSEVKASKYALKPISKILTKKPVLTKQQTELADFISNFYLAPKGVVLKQFLPKQILNRINPKELELKIFEPREKKLKKPILLWQKERTAFYKKEIQKNQTLILVPEKTLLSKYFRMAREITPETEKFHGQLKSSKEFEIFKKVSLNKTKIIVGTRASLFLPFFNLSLIILDKEESPNYKSWDLTPRYHSRSVALKLAQLTGAKIILGTEMPSVESFYFAKNNDYQLIKEVQNQTAKISFIDMKEEVKKDNYSILSDKLRQEIKGKQTIIFTGRKGLASSVRCRDCGYVITCPQCKAPMVFHETFKNQQKVLVCHHCLKTKKIPSVCPKCKGYRLKLSGAGTQKIAKELEKFKIAIFDNDTVPKITDQKKLLKDFSEKKIQILIASQLIFKYEPKAELTAIVSADHLLNLPEYRSSENFFQTISKLKTMSKKVLIQSYNKKSQLFQIIKANKIEEFYNQELRNRKMLDYPPFCKLIKLTFKDRSAKKGEETSKKLKQKLEKFLPEIKVWGPNLAFLPKIKNQYRWELIIKIKKKDYNKAKIIKQLAKDKWEIDVEPISLI